MTKHAKTTKCAHTAVNYRTAINPTGTYVQILKRQTCGGGGGVCMCVCEGLVGVVLYTVLIKILRLPPSAPAGVSGVEGVWSLRAAAVRRERIRCRSPRLLPRSSTLHNLGK